MKVAYYLSRFPTLSETFILREMCMLRELGMDVQVFSMMPPKSAPTMHRQVQSMMPFTHYSPAFSLNVLRAQFYFLFHHPIKYLRALRRLIWQTIPEPLTCLMALALFPKSVYFARQLEDLQVSHVHAHFVWLNGVGAQVASDLLGINISLHAHAWDIFRRKQECVRRQLKLATCVITVSDYHRQYLSSMNPPGHVLDIRVVHYGIDTMEFMPSANHSDGRLIQIISVGRLVEKKGFPYLVDACAILVRKGYTFRCCIVGEGERVPLQSQIDRLGLNECVTLLGAKNITDILEEYKRANIFALPCVIARSGDRDGMPNVLLEAMAMQLPVVTTPVTGNTELVHDGQNGLIVAEHDSMALAQAIERLIVDRPLREALGKQGRQTILEGFNIHSTASQLAAIFISLQVGSSV